MANHIIEAVMSTALAYVCGKFIAVICLTLILVLLTCHLLLFDRLVHKPEIMYLHVHSLCYLLDVGVSICTVMT